MKLIKPKLYIHYYYSLLWRQILGPLFVLILLALMGSNCNSTKNQNQTVKDISQKQKKIRVLFDSDTNNEIDDQHALAYLLFNQHMQSL